MADMFRRAKGLARGYDAREVDSFFARAQAVYEGSSDEVITAADVRSVTFPQVRGGYRTSAVDGALDRLDAAFARRERVDFTGANGEDAWLDQVTRLATTLYDRLARPAGLKFAPASGRKFGYRRDQVDRFCRRLVDYFNTGTPLRPTDVRQVTFTTARGKRAYEMAPVDAFLDRAIEVLTAAE